MTDRKKVIKGLEICIPLAEGETCPVHCPYYQDVCYGYSQLMGDALALLKDQEAKTVLHMAERSVIQKKALSGFCPKCSHTLIYGMNKHFCGNCGQEVKWE